LDVKFIMCTAPSQDHSPRSVGHWMPFTFLPYHGPDWTSAGNPLVIFHQVEHGLSGGTSSVLIPALSCNLPDRSRSIYALNWGF
jgi:hypothetical protein